ncbi:MAG: FKBP-type peptidyl-prolyl cis-trans isomerase [Planctomycetaceae bacterium]|jgi:FKBP-type peptidyl-prolyl cis-trans isomerase FkpA
MSFKLQRPEILSGALAVAGLLGGCAPTPPVSEKMPVPVAPSAQAKPELDSEFDGPVDFPKLPAGAGPIDEDAPREFTTTASGLKYRILRKGEGKKPTVLNKVEAHYRGWLTSGTEFDSSYKRGKPTTFPLNGVVPGWQEGIPYCAEGGMIELVIPSKLGYGSRGTGPIPPNATLRFIVELKKVL